MACIELCVIGQNSLSHWKQGFGYLGFQKNSRHTHQNRLKFSLLNSGLESFGPNCGVFHQASSSLLMIQTVLIHCGSVHLKLGTIWKEVPFNITAMHNHCHKDSTVRAQGRLASDIQPQWCHNTNSHKEQSIYMLSVWGLSVDRANKSHDDIINVRSVPL